jgi:hypothetical protein
VSASGSRGHDCGPNGDLGALASNGEEGVRAAAAARGREAYQAAGTLYWGDIPAVWTYQHWMENTLPKVAQALLLAPDAVAAQAGGAPPGEPGGVTAVQELLLDRYPIVARIYEHLGWRVADERARPVAAARMLYSCVAPPLHPYLWQVGQAAVLGVAPLPLGQRDTLVYCGRTGKGRVENAGRQVVNEAAVLAALRDDVAAPRGLRVAQFEHREHPDLPSLARFFARARAVVGPHGGCLTNVVFLGCGSSVVEIMPLVGGVRPPVGHPAMMMMMQSSFLEQDYSMLPVTTQDQAGNVDVPVQDLVAVLSSSLDAMAAAHGLPAPAPASAGARARAGAGAGAGAAAGRKAA